MGLPTCLDSLERCFMDEMRGVIRNRAFAQQIRDFSGMRFGNITPTDIDGFIEYKNRGFVVIESKFGQSKLQGGQRLAFERLIDALGTQRPSLLVVGSHTEGIGEDIIIDQSIVTEYRIEKLWRVPKTTLTVYDIVNKFLTRLDSHTNDLTIYP